MHRIISRPARQFYQCVLKAVQLAGLPRERFVPAGTPRRLRGNQVGKPAYQICEPRRLLAGIEFSAVTGQVLIGGTNADDVARVTQSGSTIIVTQRGFETQTFRASSINSILFVGLGGDDSFENRTAINSVAFGQNGNDTLIGGSGIDRLFGNGDDDIIRGNGGDDFVVGGIGNDALDAGAGNDRVLGINGNNTIEGGAGDDLIFGGNDIDIITDVSGTNTLAGNGGNDTITGGSGEDTIFGGQGNDVLSGAGGNDRIYAQAGNDFVSGGSGVDVVAGNDGDDVLQGEQGNDRIVGGSGSDRASFSGALASYDVTASGDNLRVNDLRGPNFGLNDLVIGVEQIAFGDGVRTPEQALDPTTTPDPPTPDPPTDPPTDPPQPPNENIREVVTIQPIIAANSNGTNGAEFFGNARQEANIKQRIDAIFASANVDIEFLPARRVNDTFINVGSGSGTRPRRDLSTIVSNGDSRGLGSSDRLVIDMYFVEVVPGFQNVSEFAANGLAFVGSTGVAIHIGDDLVNSADGRSTIAHVTAHEIGHNLGLPHVEGNDNLLAEGGRSTRLTQSQIDAIIASPISRPV